MIDEHTKSNQELATLAQRKNVSVSTTLASSDEKMLDKLKKTKPGADFDKAYRKQMVASHKKAVSLFDNESRHGKDADVKAWAA